MAENGTPAMSLASLVSLPQSSKPGATFFSALAQWEKEHGLGGRPREFGRIEQGRVGQRARSYTQTPRHVQYRCIQIPAAWERAGGVFRAHARRGGAGVCARAGARLGLGRVKTVPQGIRWL